jgi:hypothetical protein
MGRTFGVRPTKSDVAAFVALNSDSKTGFHLGAVAGNCIATLVEEYAGDFSVSPVCELLAGLLAGSGKTPAGTIFGADVKNGADAADLEEGSQGNLVYHFKSLLNILGFQFKNSFGILHKIFLNQILFW